MCWKFNYVSQTVAKTFTPQKQNSSIFMELCTNLQYFSVYKCKYYCQCKGNKFLQHFGFAHFLSNFCIMQHFIFPVQPWYYILPHFGFVVWPKYILIWKGCLKIKLFMCVSFQHFMNFEKTMKSKCKLQHVFCFLSLSALYFAIAYSRNSLSKISFVWHICFQAQLGEKLTKFQVLLRFK